MKEIPQWFMWKAEENGDDTLAKIPYSFDGKYRRSYNDHSILRHSMK